MKVTTYAVDFAEHEDEGRYIEDIVNNSVFDWPRVPCVGEKVGLWIEDVWIEARVESVYTNFREHGNPNVKEQFWGVDWTVCLDECEIVEHFKKKK